jgi:acyl-CoA synthetase (AMP-forming)/AMP-acid ligase II
MSDEHGTSSLLERLRRHARVTPDAVAYREIRGDADPGRCLSFGELQRRADALAAQLVDQLPTGAVVIICLPNTIHFPIAFLGALMAGCVAFPISTESSQNELIRAIKASDAKAAIATDDLLRLLAPHVRVSISPAQLRGTATCDSSNRDKAGGLLLLSSGTTEKPKIVYRSIDSLNAVSDQMVRAIGFNAGDRVLAMVPLCHSYGLEHGLLAPVAAGASVHLCPGFDLSVILRELEHGGITIFPSVPSVFEMLSQLAQPGTRASALRVAYSAGGALPRSVFDACVEKLGIQVGQLYGATEVGSITFNNPRDEGFEPASVGVPMNGVDIRIAGITEASQTLGRLTEGQVFVRANSMFSGYVGEHKSPLINGYFPTADLGFLDERNRLTITGRLKLLIDVGGLKVNPMEVEGLLMQHPSVSECVVVPVRQSQTLFRLKAVVTPRDPDRPPEVETLRQFARQRLASYKVPRVFEVRATLPHSATGKLQRHLVQA